MTPPASRQENGDGKLPPIGVVAAERTVGTFLITLSAQHE